MPTTYVGSSNFNQSITIPSDGDLADANSVNVSAKAEIDTQINLFESYGQLMQSTCPIRARRSAVRDVEIDAIPFIAVTEGGTWKTIFTTTSTTVTQANLEGGGTFTPDTWYFIYAYSVAGVCTFQISTTLPDVFLIYKNGTFSHKFICSFRTNSGSDINVFEKYGNYVTYESQLSVGGGSSITESPLSTSVYIPPTVNNVPRLCRLTMDINSNTTATDTLITVRSISGSDGYTFYARAFGLDTTFFEISTDDTRTVYYQVQNASPSPPSALFKLTGYYE